MQGRCNNPKDKDYRNYGARGIEVCERWINSFQAFVSDMGPKPSKKHSIDRIDNDGYYSPENCRWANKREQLNNTRNNRRVEIDGRTETISNWARIKGISVSSIFTRLHKGWNEVDAITIPMRPKKTFPELELAGETKTIAKWAELYGISADRIDGRLRSGWSVEDAITKPIDTKQVRYAKYVPKPKM